MLRRQFALLTQRRLVSEMSTRKVQFATNGVSRVVTLTRPEKLNALSTDMCAAILPTLQEYSKSQLNNVIVLKSSSSPRAFCAGGDVAKVAMQTQAHGHTGEKVNRPQEFFVQEYSLNFLLATYDRPIVALMDGITMGGGVGLATHVPFRVATENTKWSMPEMDIGFFPDVGTTFSLPQITTLGGTEGQLALYLCLTGDLLTGADVYVAGLASNYVSSSNLTDLQARLAELPVEDSERMYEITASALEEFSTGLPEGYQFAYSPAKLDVIEKCFDINLGLDAILKKLAQTAESASATPETKEFAVETLRKLGTKSPVSLQVAVEQFLRNRHSDVESALKQDLVTATNMCADPKVEFAAATKHKLIDKQKTQFPWTQTSLSVEELSRIVSPRPANPLSLLRFPGAVTWKRYPHHSKFMLPTEQQFRDYITGSDGSGRSLAVSRPEVVKYFSQFNASSKGKTGIEYLCNLVCDRKCTVGKAGELHWTD
ncbi:LAMI_0C05512g1_1 [Lachancea mirantina]|uniref:3-hydroxyisobutyryl-CoA hydrolase n=1 Tax=Lachancea mirantina TaxID=1230905 RepID=A0A1G4J3D4_9SACH|nr:LAMI_0C05512g1_1 [Lachancea mirantina]